MNRNAMLALLLPLSMPMAAAAGGKIYAFGGLGTDGTRRLVPYQDRLLFVAGAARGGQLRSLESVDLPAWLPGGARSSIGKR